MSQYHHQNFTDFRKILYHIVRIPRFLLLGVFIIFFGIWLFDSPPKGAIVSGIMSAAGITFLVLLFTPVLLTIFYITVPSLLQWSIDSLKQSVHFVKETSWTRTVILICLVLFIVISLIGVFFFLRRGSPLLF